jgi:mRNA interferase YafQ
MKYIFQPSSKFKKSFKKLRSNRNFDIKNFEKVLNTLIDGGVLDKKYKNHKLKGEDEGLLECHLQNDILLIYKYVDDSLILYALDIGSHSDLF